LVYTYQMVKRGFGLLMVITACAMAFAHGSNDVANAIGPLAAVVSTVEHMGAASTRWFWYCGWSSNARSQSNGNCRYRYYTVVLASGTGLPISTTQTLVGAILGVGFARGIAALNLGVIRNIVASWIVTLPAGALLAVVFFYAIQASFG